MAKFSHFNIPVWRTKIKKIPFINNYAVMIIVGIVAFIALSWLHQTFSFLLYDDAIMPSYINPLHIFIYIMTFCFSLIIFFVTIILQITRYYRFNKKFSIEFSKLGRIYITDMIAQCPFCESVMILSPKEKKSRNPIFLCTSYQIHRIAFLPKSMTEIDEDYQKQRYKKSGTALRQIKSFD